jgi:glycosyltransferase involved in cell wall biosynthesis
MRIAMLGNRGVPANWGGSDTATEEIGARLVARGHEVTVYCRTHNSDYQGSFYRGMRRIVLPSLKVKSMDTLGHSLISLLHAQAFDVADVMSFNGVGNSFVLPLVALRRGKASVVVIDGPDWTRPKWGRLGRSVLRNSVWWMVRYADVVIADNVPIREWLARRYGRDSELIYYGADREIELGTGALERLGVEPDEYYLCSGVLTPDKGQDVAINALRGLDTTRKLVVLGAAEYAELGDYAAGLRRDADDRVVFGGFVPPPEFKELVRQCRVYLHPLKADGSSPALIQAMSLGKCIVASSLIETREILGDAGSYVSPGSVEELRRAIESIEADPQKREAHASAAEARARQLFDWDQVTEQYEAAFRKALTRSAQRGGVLRRASASH